MKDANYWIKYGEWYDSYFQMLENLEKSENSKNKVVVIVPSDEDSIDNV